MKKQKNKLLEIKNVMVKYFYVKDKRTKVRKFLSIYKKKDEEIKKDK